MNEDLKEKLESMYDDYFKEYANMQYNTSEYFLTVGKCSGIREVIELLDKDENSNYSEKESFWERLNYFIDKVQVNDPMSYEEKEMILNVCKENLN